MKIRKSNPMDLAAMQRIYDAARRFMAEMGNSSQWQGGYPSNDLLLADMERDVSYVVEHNGYIVGTFAFIPGEDPTYASIEGAWPDNEPYGTIHRIASDGSMHGIADACLEFCLSKRINIRIDTHADNKMMLRWVERAGFARCGIIHIADGTPRIAFQLTKK